MSEVSLQVDGGLRYHLEEDVVHAVEAVYPDQAQLAHLLHGVGVRVWGDAETPLIVKRGKVRTSRLSIKDQ